MAVKLFESIGLLREVVKFERNNPTDTDSGGQEDAYTEFLTTRGKVRQKGTGNRSLEAGTVLLNNQFEVIVRFQDALNNELTADGTVRIVYNNRFFTIHDWRIYEERFRYIVFSVSVQHI